MAASAVWVLLHVGAHWFDQLDVRVYRMGARALLSGSGLYSTVEPTTGLPFTYPPFAAAAMIPLAWLPTPVAGLVVGITSCLALARIAHLCVTRVAPLPRLEPGAATWLVLAVGMLSEPVASTLWFGQVNLVLTWLVLEDLTRPPGRMSGIATGLATAVKLVPGVFLVWAWLAGRSGTALRGMLAFIATGALAAATFWNDSALFWSGMFADAGHVGGIPYQGNQSVLGVAARLLGTAAPPAAVHLVGATALTCALGLGAWFARRGEAGRGLVLAGIGGLLASPISWSHHWIWWLPMACVLAADAAARRPGARWLLVATLLVFLVRPLWWPSPVGDAALHFSGVEQLLTAAYALWAVAVLAWHVWIWIGERRSGTQGTDEASRAAHAGS
ncbi:MAG: glycosyltransferase 87 family protein [Candidatus Nanopelagicales bacterium]